MELSELIPEGLQFIININFIQVNLQGMAIEVSGLPVTRPGEAGNPSVQNVFLVQPARDSHVPSRLYNAV